MRIPFKSVPAAFLLAVVIVSLVAVAARSLKPVHAEPSDPAAIEASVEWLRENTPKIKELKAQLAPLEEERDRHKATLEVWSYDFDWIKLEPVKLPLGEASL